MAKKIFVWIKEPMKKARHVYISSTLENLQKTVGGYLEEVGITTDSCILCNEDGRANDYFNVRMLGSDFYGTLIFVGRKDGEVSDWPLSNEDTKKMFPDIFKEG